MPEVQVISALYFDARRRPVEADDPAAEWAEVVWIDVNGDEHTEHGPIGR